MLRRRTWKQIENENEDDDEDDLDLPMSRTWQIKDEDDLEIGEKWGGLLIAPEQEFVNSEPFDEC